MLAKLRRGRSFPCEDCSVCVLFELASFVAGRVRPGRIGIVVSLPDSGGRFGQIGVHYHVQVEVFDTVSSRRGRRTGGIMQVEARRAAGLPVLPREVFEHVIAYLALPASEGDEPSMLALVRLSCVCHLCRHWAFQALYDVLVLPRHVRDFRKWYARMRNCVPPFPCVGYVRALFVGIDDVRGAPRCTYADYEAHGVVGWLGERAAPAAALQRLDN